LPQKIEQLESQVGALTERMQQADFYTQPADRITAHTRDLENAQAELDAAYVRWAELDG
ncbi:MAG: hypothetical protein RIS14_1447, partial [Pseudomonadota bacterium]